MGVTAQPGSRECHTGVQHGQDAADRPPGVAHEPLSTKRLQAKARQRLFNRELLIHSSPHTHLC